MALSRSSPYVQSSHRVSGLMLANHTSICSVRSSNFIRANGIFLMATLYCFSYSNGFSANMINYVSVAPFWINSNVWIRLKMICPNWMNHVKWSMFWYRSTKLPHNQIISVGKVRTANWIENFIFFEVLKREKLNLLWFYSISAQKPGETNQN